MAVWFFACTNQGAPLQGILGASDGSMSPGGQPDGSVAALDGSVDQDSGCPQAPSPPVAVPCLPDGGPSLSPVVIPAVSENEVFQFTISTSCGSPPYGWQIVGPLPTGVTVQQEQNAVVVISGKPTEAQSCPTYSR